MPLQATSGAASYDAFGGGVAAVPNYIEECFSAFLYTGNGSTQTITNGIDLSGKGGLVWLSGRNTTNYNCVLDTNRGLNVLSTHLTDAQFSSTTYNTFNSFNSNGFTLGSDSLDVVNRSTYNFASWTFRKQPKFFDVVTYTGDGVAGRQIAHNLGSAPGCIIIKNYSGTDAGLRGWGVWHRTLAEDYHLTLNSTAAQTLNTSYPLFGKPAQQTSTYFTVGQSDATGVNATTNGTGLLYVAYLFAHDAGGFGLTGTDNVISCGSYTGTGTAGLSVTLGYEPQWLLVKNASSSIANWVLVDNMRGFSKSSTAALFPNLSEAEITWSPDRVSPNATGFTLDVGTDENLNKSGSTHIYIAIRRGPMKVPTSGTSVFEPLSRNGTGTNVTISSSGVGPVDMIMADSRNVTNGMRMWDRLRGPDKRIATYSTDQEFSTAGIVTGFDSMTGVRVYDPGSEFINTTGTGASPYINYMFKRAPSFFDEVCYTGNGSVPQTVPHNLGAVPELMIVKNRSDVTNWATYNATNGPNYYMNLNSTAAAAAQIDRWRNTAPTSTNFYVGATNNVSGNTYVAYLFATCAGVSKVGSYTGTGTTKQVDCGFTGGARFVLIKRTDSTGAWYVWDSARGIVAGNDPYLLLNSTDAEVTSTDYIDTYSAGFEISSTAPAAINASGGTFIFLAIA